MKTNILFIFYCFVFVSCVSSNNQSSQKISKSITLKPWIGKNIVEVLKHPKYGTPSKKEKIGSSEFISYMEYFSTSGHISDNSIHVNLLCKRSFIYNNESIIIDVLEEGTTCQNTNENLPNENVKN